MGLAPNGIQIGASVTMEFNRGGKPKRQALSSAKSSSLAVSSQQNSADTEAPSKPTPGSAERGGPTLSRISTAGLHNLPWPQINRFESPTHSLIGIHMKSVAWPSLNPNQKRNRKREQMSMGLKTKNFESIDSHCLEGKDMKGHNSCINDRNNFFLPLTESPVDQNATQQNHIVSSNKSDTCVS